MEITVILSPPVSSLNDKHKYHHPMTWEYFIVFATLHVLMVIFHSSSLTFCCLFAGLLYLDFGLHRDGEYDKHCDSSQNHSVPGDGVLLSGGLDSLDWRPREGLL